MQSEEIIVHPYDWQVYDEYDDNGHCVIMAWCLDKKSKPYLLRFHDFPAFCHVELPLFVNGKRILWSTFKVKQVFKTIQCKLRRYAPFKFFFKKSKKLYYYRNDRTYPMMVLLFDTLKGMYFCKSMLSKAIKVNKVGVVACKVWETNITPIRKLLSLRNSKYSQWFSIEGIKITGSDKISTLENEYIVDRKKLNPIPPNISKSWVTYPNILEFDIECYSHNHNTFPNRYLSKDVPFAISCVFQRAGHKETRIKDAIIFGDVDPKQIKNADSIIKVKSETELIDKMCDLIVKYDPEIISGYNIFGFDYPYLNTRLERRMKDWRCIGRIINEKSKLISFSWGSSGYGHNQINILNMPGRISLDMYPIIRRDYKLSKYSLDFVSNYFLGRGKHDVSAKEMFRAFENQQKARKNLVSSLTSSSNKWKRKDLTFDKLEILQISEWHKSHSFANKDQYNNILTCIHNYVKARNEMTRVMAYCMEDSILCIDLFDKINCWIGLIELSNVVGVTPVELFTRGQQLRVLSQVYDVSSKQNFVIDERIIPKISYSGGFVYEPIPGIYNLIPCLDFKSLYPTVMMAYNICYTTFVPPELMDKIPDKDCHVLEWSEELPDNASPNENSLNNSNDDGNDSKNKSNDIAKTKVVHHRYKFIKKPKGLLPQLLEQLIGERDQVKKQLKNENDPVTKVVLDRRQLALKISANSIYGSLGAQVGGKLPLPEAAACVTAKSRESIKLVNSYLESKGKKIVYGDSVTKDTPIICRFTYENGLKKLCIRPISNIYEEEKLWVTNNITNKEYLVKPKSVEVWSDKGFTAIKHIMRHKTHKKIYRIITHTGVVKVTEDHSLLDEFSNIVQPHKTNIGDRLLTYSLPSLSNDGINIAHSWVWGLFYGYGSCDVHNYKYGCKYSWAINNQNLQYLNTAKKLLETSYPNFGFKILNTMTSSSAYKLVPLGNIKKLVIEWRNLFYDPLTNHKKIPDELWQSSYKTRKDFYNGYYATDGDKDKHGYERFCNKGQIGSAGLFLLAKSLGYKVYCNTSKDEMNIYRLTLTKSYQRKHPGIIKKIEDLGYVDDYVYDLETENHHFAAGVGELIVHNTDSSMPDLGLTDPKTAYAECEKWADELSKLFPPPMLVEVDWVAHTMFNIKKKKYAYNVLQPNGDADFNPRKIKTKGIALARRDNCAFQRRIMRNVLHSVLTRKPMMETFNYILEECQKLLYHQVPWQDLVIIKGLGSNYKNKHYQMKIFSDELIRIGKPANPGERLEYVVVNTHGVNGKQLLGYKMRLPSTYLERLESDQPERIDYNYYIDKVIQNCVEQLFAVGYKDELDKLEQKYKDMDYKLLLNDLRKRGYGIVIDQLMMKHSHDKIKVIDDLLKTDISKIVKKLINYHVVKYRRLITRVNKQPIKNLLKYISEKKKITDYIKTLVPVSNIPKMARVKLNVLKPGYNLTTSEVQKSWNSTKISEINPNN